MDEVHLATLLSKSTLLQTACSKKERAKLLCFQLRTIKKKTDFQGRDGFFIMLGMKSRESSVPPNN